ncbi:MAG: tRNA pseudouridine(55) synthase TruB [Betaproteobacteria bacterium]|nr:tRNA pseudouridine(55) synthase TruB [Betaproteobacteria bacterium]
MTRAARRPRAAQHAVDGVLMLDKPAGITSHTAVQCVRRLLHARKAGHTGTLDPLATGLLPVCLGEATKFSHALLDADKTYLATIRLGITTTTGDLEGEMTAQAPVEVSEAQARAALSRFVGEILQVPPMYSAIKHGGQPLYKLARAGQDLPRTPRRVFIRELTLIRFVPPELDVSVTCSKGTYVRVLAEDVGRELGCGGCLAGLRRTAVGEFSAAGMVTVERLEALALQDRMALLLPADALLSTLPRLDLDAGEAGRLQQGQPVDRPDARTPGLVRIYGANREFLGMAEVIEPGRIVPRRLRSQPPSATEATAGIS